MYVKNSLKSPFHDKNFQHLYEYTAELVQILLKIITPNQMGSLFR